MKALEKLVALALLDHWSRSRDTFPSLSRLAQWTSLSRRSVVTHLAALERAQAIRVTRTHGRANRYDLGPLLTLHQCTSCTSAGDAPVQEMHGTSAGDAPPVVQEMHPKGSIEGTQEGTQLLTRTKRAPKSAAPRLRRVPDSWEPSDAHRQLATSRGIDFDVELASFRDYEFATPKTDFDAAFRNWLRRARPMTSRSTPAGVQSTARTGWTPSRFQPVQPNHGPAYDPASNAASLDELAQQE